MIDPFLQMLRAAVACRGLLIGDDGRFSADPDYRGANPPTPEHLEVLNSFAASNPRYAEVQRQWARDLLATIDRLIEGKSTDPEALRVVLFLRLRGLVVDFRNQYSVGAALLGNTQSVPGSSLAWLANTLNAIDQLKNTLSEDEQLYAEYRRHVDAHIRQGAYNLQWNKKKSTVRREFDSAFTGKTYEVIDLNERIARTISSYGGDELKLAIDFAQRMHGPAAMLLVAIERQR